MAHSFDEATIAGVLGHMNREHNDDNLLIARAFGPDGGAVEATMTAFDGEGGQWSATGADGAVLNIRVPWPGGAITERAAVRREIVALYDAACTRLGLEPRPHA
jgi:hypothetical protein